MQICPDLTSIALPTNISDHTLILIRFKEGNKQDKNAPSIYINNWTHWRDVNNVAVKGSQLLHEEMLLTILFQKSSIQKKI